MSNHYRHDLDKDRSQAIMTVDSNTGDVLFNQVQINNKQTNKSGTNQQTSNLDLVLHKSPQSIFPQHFPIITSYFSPTFLSSCSLSLPCLLLSHSHLFLARSTRRYIGTAIRGASVFA